MRELSRAIASEEAAIRVLRAELAYLESPARLSKLNDTYLGLKPVRPDQERVVGDVEALFPLLEVGEK